MADRPVLVLGSASPARAQLLRSAGLDPIIRPSAVDEESLVRGSRERAQDVRWLAQMLAREKARDVARAVASGAGPGPAGRTFVLGADSLFDVAGRALGKAKSPDEVRRRWTTMSGGTGTLVTGHTLIEVATGREVDTTCATVVRFGRPDPIELEAYIESGEPLEVAGSCTIDGLGAAFVEGVDGDHTNVIGLSVPALRRMFGQFGVRWTDLWSRR